MQGLGPVVQGRFVPGEELGSLHPLQNWCWYKFFTSAPVCNCRVPAVVWLISPWQCDGQSEKQVPGIPEFPWSVAEGKSWFLQWGNLIYIWKPPCVQGWRAESCSSWVCGTVPPPVHHYVRMGLMELPGDAGCAQNIPKLFWYPHTRTASGPGRCHYPWALCWVSFSCSCLFCPSHVQQEHCPEQLKMASCCLGWFICEACKSFSVIITQVEND